MRTSHTAAVGPAPEPAQMRRMYELMTLMKVLDERIVKGIGTGEFIAFYYSHRGQESIAAALGTVLRDSDQLVTTYRGVHDHIGKGTPLIDVLGAVLGREVGGDRGKSSTLNISCPESGAMFSTGIVGGGLPIAAGLGLSAQLAGLDRVVAVCFGDGSTSTGSFHEAANLASVWNLPVIFVCQNNQFGEKTPVHEAMKIQNVSERAGAYAMPGVTVDGNDPDAVFSALAWAADRARHGEGPALVECVTYRLRGHSQGDDMAYMPEDERAKALESDPVPTYRQHLLAADVCSEAELAALDAEAARKVEEALAEVVAAPVPSTVGEGMYLDPTNVPV